MNKRIRELAEQAGFIGESMYPIFGTCQETALKNFAELIVQDCIKWSIKNKFVESEYDAPTFTKGLKKRFGVK